MSNIPDDAETIKRLFEEKQQLIGMMLRLRKAFYVDGTTKAVRQAFLEINDEFKILRGEIQP